MADSAILPTEGKGMPINGTKMHPLSDFAIGILQMLARKPMPRQEVNPGVCARLEAEHLVELRALPSPYKKHSKFIKVQFLHITDAGRAALQARKSAEIANG